MTKHYDGATVEEALQKAASALDAEVEDLEYEVVQEGKKDFWGLDEPYVRLRAWLIGQAPDRGAEAAADATADEARPAPEAAASAGEPALRATGFWGEGALPTQEAPPAEETRQPPPAAKQPEEAPPRVPAPEEPRRETAPGGEAAEEAEELAVQTDVDEIEEPLDEIEGFVDKIFEDMGFDCEVEAHAEEDSYLALISGDDKEYLLEGQGRALSALELILNHAFRHRLPDGKKIRVDAGDFRSRREEELRDLAYQVAHSAKESGQTQETQPLNPYERRLVHLALADDPAVTTRSRGSGFLKNVQIIPKKSGGGRGRRF